MDNQPNMIIGSQVDRSQLEELRKLRIYSEDVVNIYSHLLHYCSIETLGYIFNKNTLRCSSLNNANLNDQFEAKRKNVERFAGSRFITCFSHCQHEIVPLMIKNAK